MLKLSRMAKKKNLLLCLLAIVQTVLHAQALGTDPEKGRGTYKNRTFFNLERYWDTARVLNNPHKGWYVHHFSNSVSNYGDRIQRDDSLANFPGLNDFYFRLAWSYLEPEEGRYNWLVIDSAIDRWVRRGHTISFRITCKETMIQYATPEWVRKAGAKGKFIKHPDLKIEAWAPDYGDKIFLRKLEAFHKAFAARYDSKPWVEYIDIGSFGDWGEGHTGYSGWEDVPVSIVKQHIDLHKKYYKRSTLVISDDALAQRDTDDGADYIILDYCKKNKIGFRDDSGNVLWYKNLGFGPSCIRSPEFYSAVYKTIPVVLESDHYGDAKENGMWGDGSGFEKAVEETKATFIGFHYYPNEWLAENLNLAKRLANKAGYWYFPKFVMMPDTLRKSSTKNYIRITWENHGVAPAYNGYDLYIKLIPKDGGTAHEQKLVGVKNTTWMPDEITAEQYHLAVNKVMKPGTYDILIGMKDNCAFHKGRAVELGILNSREKQPGFYSIGEIIVH
jgi:hypothetical protein